MPPTTAYWAMCGDQPPYSGCDAELVDSTPRICHDMQYKFISKMQSRR